MNDIVWIKPYLGNANVSLVDDRAGEYAGNEKNSPGHIIKREICFIHSFFNENLRGVSKLTFFYIFIF